MNSSPEHRSLVEAALLNPSRLFSREEVLTTIKDLVPRTPGVYAWYFREVPSGVPTENCHRLHDATLLYVGISPKRPPQNGAPPSRQNLRKRIRYHYRGNAYGSTLRLTLGCLLAQRLGIQLQRTGRTGRLTFGDGEKKLSEWMGTNAFVCWAETPAPWEVEEQLIRRVSLPLNLDQNSAHPFCRTLRACRADAKNRARD